MDLLIGPISANGAGRNREENAMLDMKSACEKCEAPTPKDGAAEICSFECTFCPPCAETMGHTCPNCGGELLARPKRTLDV